MFQDVAARGLDLPQVTWILQVSPDVPQPDALLAFDARPPVFQYTPPTAAAEYVHRIGRTARVGEAGSSLIFLTPAETAFIQELANHNIR